MSSELRAPTLDDLDALTAFFEAIRDTYHSRGQTRAQIEGFLTSRHANVPENFRIAVENGRIAGWAAIWSPKDAPGRIYFHIEALPREGAMYARLLDWSEARAAEIGDGRGTVQATVEAGDDAFDREVRRRGYQLVRHFFDMEVALAEEASEPAWPEGISLQPYEPGDERAVFDADMEAFEDHWDSMQIPFEEWREHFVDTPEFDPSLWFLAWDGDELAGFAICTGERRPNTGYVNVLAVRRPWRNRGLGTALLLHSFGELRERGRARADLNVDGESLTGAVRLYERAGMEVVRRFDHYRKEVP